MAFVSLKKLNQYETTRYIQEFHALVKNISDNQADEYITDHNKAYQAFMNQQVHQRLHHEHLKVVVGSLGIGVNSPYFEFGLPFGVSVQAIEKTSDYHVWLEDDQGNVLDFTTESMVQVAKSRGKIIHFDKNELIFLQSKASLKNQGLHYVAGEDQDCLIKALKMVSCHRRIAKQTLTK